MPDASGPAPSFFAPPVNRGTARVVPEDAPLRIVDDGLIRLGLFKNPVRQMNLTDSRLLKGFGESWPSPPLLVEWVGAGMAHPDWYMGLIVVDARVGSLAVVYGYNRRTRDYFSHDRVGLRRQVKVAGSTWNDTTRFEGRGFRIEIIHRLEHGFHEVNLDIAKAGKKPAVKGRVVWSEPLGKTQPLVLMSPLENNGFIYNHKAQMPIEGTLRIGGEEVEFSSRRDVANMDDLKIHPASRKLAYRWFNFGGFDPKGRLVGADLAHTPQKPDPYWEENCIWSGDKLSMCGTVRFEMDRNDLMKPWRAVDDEGRVDITFYPEGGKAVKLGPLGSYHQKCGRFRGKLVDASGEKHEIRDYYGCAEAANILT